MEYDAPIALLVLATLDDERSIVGNRARSGALGANQFHKVALRVPIETVGLEACGQFGGKALSPVFIRNLPPTRSRSASIVVGPIEPRDDRAQKIAAHPSRLGGAADALAVPER